MILIVIGVQDLNGVDVCRLSLVVGKFVVQCHDYDNCIISQQGDEAFVVF